MMRTSPIGIALIKRFEGLELEAYQDIAGVWTIGYGHTGKYPDWLCLPGLPVPGFVGPDQGITAEQAERLLRDDLKSREDALRCWSITNGVDLNENEFDALISFIFNVGLAAFKGSTAARRLIKGDRKGAADALTWWNKATVAGKLREVTGLTRRRNAEMVLFLTPPNWSAPPRMMGVTALSPDAVDHRESNCRPVKQTRPLTGFIPSFIQECLPR